MAIAVGGAAGCDGGAGVQGEPGMASDMAVTSEMAPQRGHGGFAQGASAEVAGDGLAMKAAPPPPAPGAGGETVPAAGTEVVAPAMLIRTGMASVEVQDLDAGMAAVRALAARVGGYVTNTSVHGGRDAVRSASLEIRVPAARFDAAMAGLEPLGTVESVNVSAEDVGEEYADLDARVANARRLEARLQDLLATRTGRLEDVLAVERELARVREGIERVEGRMRFLRTRAATSTLTVQLHEPAPIVGRVGGKSPIAEAVRQAWRNLVGVTAGLIALSGSLIPVLVVGAVVWLVVRRLGRAARARRAARGEPEPAGRWGGWPRHGGGYRAADGAGATRGGGEPPVPPTGGSGAVPPGA